MKYFYSNIVDEGSAVEVTIIQHNEKNRKVEVIRNSRINGRTHYSGFWVSMNELIVLNKERNTYFRKLLKKK